MVTGRGYSGSNRWRFDQVVFGSRSVGLLGVESVGPWFIHCPFSDHATRVFVSSLLLFFSFRSIYV